jgi:hypothetical protein
MPLKDLSAAGGWKDPNTILMCYREADAETMRRALENRGQTRPSRDTEETQAVSALGARICK